MTDTLHIATRDIVGIGDEVTRYPGDQTTERQLRLTREISWWPFGNRRAQYLRGSLEIDNRSGKYDQLINIDIRDQPVTLWIVPEGPTFQNNQRVRLVTGVSDSLEAPEDSVIRITITDPLSRFDRAATRRIPDGMAADADDPTATLTGKRSPVLFGVGRNIRPPIVEGVGPTWSGPVWRVSDGPLSAIAVVRSRAFPLNGPNDSPAQWDFALSGAGFEANVNEFAPIGPITCDASTSGEAQLGESPADLLNGGGILDQPFDGQSGANVSGTSTDMPEGWFYRTRNAGIESANPADWKVISRTTSADGRHLWFETGGVSGQTSTGWIEIRYDDDNSPPFRFEAGKVYRWRLRRVGTLTGGFPTPGGLSGEGRIRLIAGPEATSSSSVDTYPNNRILASFRAFNGTNSDPGTFSGTFTAPPTADGQPLLIRASGWVMRGGIKNLTIEEVPEAIEDELEGISLRDFIAEILTRSGESVTEAAVSATSTFSVNFDDLDAIEGGDSPKKDIGYWYEEPPTTIELLRAPLDSFTADLYTSRSGVMRFARMEPPEDMDADYTIDGNHIQGEARIEIDGAQGLTTTATARPNWFIFRDSDFVDNFDDVPIEMRQRFSEVGQFTVRAKVPDDYPSQYLHALDAGPLNTLFDNPEDAANEIQRIVDFYEVLRRFITVKVQMDILPEPGDVVEIKYHKWGLEEGKKMRVISVTDNINDSEAAMLTHDLVLHG